MPWYHKFLTNSVFSLNLRLSWYSQKVICLIFSQGNQAGDGRGAQYSYAESSYPQSSFVSSTSSKTSFRPSSSSASGGVFGSSARNDRTSALKAAFQVFVMNFFFFYRSPFFFKYVRLEICNIQSHNYLLTKTLSLWSVRCYNLNPFFPFVPHSSADKISHLLPADSLVLFDLMLLLLCCSTRTNHSLGDLFDVDIFKFFTFWSLGPVQVSLLRCIFLCV